MGKTFASLIMGLILIALGILFFLHNLDIIWLEGQFIAASILFVLGLSFLLYIIADRSLWWPLIPSIILFALSAIALLSYFDIDGEWLGSIFLWGTGLAFIAVYLKQRSNVWSLIPTWLAVVLGFVVLAVHLEEYIYWWESGLGGSVFFVGVALAFLAYYIKRKKHWWSLFISLLLFTLAGVVAAAVTIDYEELAGSVFLWGAGISFVSIFIQKRDHWWAIIPGGALLVLGMFPMMEAFNWGWDILNAFILFLGFGLVFALLSLIKVKGKRLSWALKPAFILIGFSFFLLLFAPESSILRTLFPFFLMGLGISLIAKYALKRKPT